MEDRSTIFIGGEWVGANSDRVIEIENPASGDVIATVPEATSTDVDHAVAAARAAFSSWSETTPARRVAVLRALQDELDVRQPEIAATVTSEMGAPIWLSERIQAALPVTVVGAYADLLERYVFEKERGSTLVRREAAGVVAAVTPWNYPLHQITAKLAPALAAGCTFVLKPSEQTPMVAYLLMEACEAAGVPAGVVNLVPGYGQGVGESLVGHPGVDVVSFTGSLAAGARVGALASRNIARVTLELGGKSANVILDDADLAVAVKVGMANAFLNSGQTCTAWTRMLVPAERHDDAIELARALSAKYVVGDPTDPATKLGPVVSQGQRDRVWGLIDTAVAEGARVIAGGVGAPDGLTKGYYVKPTVLADVAPESTIAQQEVFGPVLSIIAYDGDDEALAIANDSEYGLHGGVWSSDPRRALEFARGMRTGSVDINGARYNPMAPFGGYKKSGVGREMGDEGFEEFLEVKAIGLA